MFTGLSAEYSVYGRSFMRLNAVYLSGAPVANTTFYNPFSAVPKLSASYQGFTAYKLLSSDFSTNFDNTITIKVPAPIAPGYIDVIAQNPAGYGTLTRFVIKEPYSGTQSLSALRPWSLGVKVLSGVETQILPINLIYTLNGSYGIETFDNKGIITFNTLPSSQMFSINNNVIVTINGDNILTI
jgi:hypothetical protein